MSKSVNVIVLRTAGTNCDVETAAAFSYFGAKVDCVHINKLFKKKVLLSDYHIVALPGGFTYGDDIESGRILANELIAHLGNDLRKFISDGKLIIGICNGFQVLVKAGILPGTLDNKNTALDWSAQATLTNNDSGRFTDRWTYLKSEGHSIWTQNLDDIIYLPIAHAEGKFLTRDENVLLQLNSNHQVALRYCSSQGENPKFPDNPNGSIEDIAGITDMSGRVLGLMPHPERHFLFHHHPRWTRQGSQSELGHGAVIFKNGIDYVQRTFLS